MLLLDGEEDTLALDAILVTAIAGAQRLGLHRLGDAVLEVSEPSIPLSGNTSQMLAELPQIRTEVGIRIWSVVRRYIICLRALSLID